MDLTGTRSGPLDLDLMEVGTARGRSGRLDLRRGGPMVRIWRGMKVRGRIARGEGLDRGSLDEGRSGPSDLDKGRSRREGVTKGRGNQR